MAGCSNTCAICQEHRPVPRRAVLWCFCKAAACVCLLEMLEIDKEYGELGEYSGKMMDHSSYECWMENLSWNNH